MNIKQIEEKLKTYPEELLDYYHTEKSSCEEVLEEHFRHTVCESKCYQDECLVIDVAPELLEQLIEEIPELADYDLGPIVLEEDNGEEYPEYGYTLYQRKTIVIEVN